MAQKINSKNPNKWSFFQSYHDENSILYHDCRPNVSLREPKNNRTYCLHNKSKKEIVVYMIDGGVINSDEVLKCDNGIYTEDDWLFLVELKGKDLNHALDQINSTINILLKKRKILVKKLNVRIVLSKVCVPRFFTSKENKLKQLLHKSYGGGDYKKQSRNLDDTI